MRLGLGHGSLPLPELENVLGRGTAALHRLDAVALSQRRGVLGGDPGLASAHDDRVIEVANSQLRAGGVTSRVEHLRLRPNGQRSGPEDLRITLERRDASRLLSLAAELGRE